MEIVRLENVCLYEKNGSGIENIAMSVEPGQIWGILGAAGSGKTALCELLSGREEPDGGVVCREPADPFRRAVTFVPARMRLRTGMHCANFMAAMGETSGIRPDYSWILEQCCCFGLRPKASVRRMSEGEQKRLALLGAVQHPGRLLVLDEPSRLLSAGQRTRFFSLLHSLQEEEIGIVFTTDSLEEIRRYATHTLILDGGQTLVQGLTGEMPWLSFVTVNLQLFGGKVEDCMTELGVANYTEQQGLARFFYGGSLNTLVQVLSRWPLFRLEILEPDLESIMKVWRTGGKSQEFMRSQRFSRLPDEIKVREEYPWLG